jgi:glycosyltransferase involved in cell wall biosynthesis
MKSSRVIGVLERIEWFLYRRASHIVTVTHSFREHLLRGGIPAQKISVITNGVDLARYSVRPKDPDLVRELGLEGAFVAGYIGTHGMAHALQTLLEAAAQWSDESAGVPLKLLLVGDGADKPKLRERAAELGLAQRVIFVDTVSKDQIVRYWSLLDVCIVHLRRTPLFETVIPSKLFESMAMGVPILLGVVGEAQRIVEGEGCGVCFVPEDAAALGGRLRQMAQDPGLRAQLSSAGVDAASRYARDSLAARMLAILSAVARREAVES